MATVYIAETGDDSTGDGTEVNPWATLAKAHTETTDGDTIVMSGTYDMQVTSLNQARYYKGYDCTLIKSGAGNKNIGAVNKDTNIEGFTWTGNHFGNDWGSAYVLNSGTGEIHIKNNKFIDIVGRSDTRFSSSFFGRGSYDALITTNIKITGSLIYGMQSVSTAEGYRMSFIGFNQDDEYPVNLSMIGNTIYLNKTGSEIQHYIFETRLNSTSGEAYTINFYNNIVYGVDGATHRILDSGVENFISDYNCYYGSFSGEPTYGDNDIFVDPKFIDAPNYDFRLQTNSPCLGTGNPAV